MSNTFFLPMRGLRRTSWLQLCFKRPYFSQKTATTRYAIRVCGLIAV